MTEPRDRERASLSTVSPVVERSHAPEDLAEEAVVRVFRRVSRSALRWLLGRAGLLIGGFAGGAGVVVGLDDEPDAETPVERPAAASGPEPVRSSAELDSCEQCRDDARLAVEVFAAQARACGIEPDELPRAAPPPPTHERSEPASRPAHNGESIQ